MSSLRRFAIALLVAVLVPAAAWAAPVGSAFNYQGKLDRSGAPYSGTADFQFGLWDAATAGTQVGTTLTLTGVSVTNGVFTIPLDFGAGAFAGQARWLEISVKASGDATSTLLTPRQALTPTPYAMYALSAPGGGGGSPWVLGADGHDLTYGGGGVGITGASSPFASGTGLFLENYAAGGYIFGFDYTNFAPKNLILQSPGGNVGIRTTTPGHELDVTGVGRFTNSGNTQDGEGYSSALWAIGNTGGGFFGRVSNGLTAFSTDARAVYGLSNNNWGVTGECQAGATYGILGTPNEGVYGISTTMAHAGARFVCPSGGIAIDASAGLVKVKTLQITGGADLAERFEAPAGSEPGTVMAIDPSSPGRLRTAETAYCRTVAGVVSGANGLDAGVELGRGEPAGGAVALALTGRVWVKCDATGGAIHAGDLLTTSDRAGYAMAVRDHDRAQGAILGKAMSALETGTGLVLALVSLQ